MSKINTVVKDVNKIFSQIGSGKPVELPEKKVDILLNNLKEVLHQWSTPREKSVGLRMSNVGRPNRQLWYDIKSNKDIIATIAGFKREIVVISILATSIKLSLQFFAKVSKFLPVV